MRILALLALAACEPVDAPDDGSAGYSERKVDLGTVTSTAGGVARFDVTLREGDTGFTFFGSAGQLLSIEQIVDPDGLVQSEWQTWLNGDRDLTDAFWPYYDEVAFTWPMRASEAPIQTGTWQVQIATSDADWNYLGRVPVTASVRIREDRRDDEGTVRVVFVWADGVHQEPGVAEATEAATAHWRDIWEQAGLTLETRDVETDLDPVLQPPWMPGSAVGEAATYADDGEIVVLMGETFNDNLVWYGVSGGIPGPLEVTEHSATSVAWLANAGADGEFSEDDILLFGETLAHEVGHYMGLQHPVQSDYARWDAINDTIECMDQPTCDDVLGTNIMFPYSICDASGCVDTTELTADQIAQLGLAGATR